jgi:hypothetical protein
VRLCVLMYVSMYVSMDVSMCLLGCPSVWRDTLHARIRSCTHALRMCAGTGDFLLTLLIGAQVLA